MNILITSIGKRGYLIDHFREVISPDDNIYAADASKYAPALEKADRSFLLPLASESNYKDSVNEISKEYDIDFILSINDLELPYLAKYKKFIESDKKTVVLVSDKEVIDVCFDKYKTYEFLKKNDINTPATTIDPEVILKKTDFPIVAKPRRGSRSEGIFKFSNYKEFQSGVKYIDSTGIDYIYQEYIDSEQYSIHVLNDLDKKPVDISTMVNIKPHMDGETFQIKTFSDKNLFEVGLKLGKAVKHIGPLSADVHFKESTGYVILELNPRIPGCFSLSHYSNDHIKKLYRIFQGDNIMGTINSNEKDVIMLKDYSVHKSSEKAINDLFDQEG